MKTMLMIESSGEVANLSNDSGQDPDQNKIDPTGSGDDKLDGLTDINSEPDFGAGAVQSMRRLASGRIVSDHDDRRAVEPMGIDDEDSDDFNTGTTGPTITQTEIDPENSYSGSRKLASGIVVEGSWADVQAKAARIYKDGGVRIISVTGPYVAGNVKGSEGVYETTLQRGQSGSIDQWTCSCPWFAYSFGRSGRWKKYEGRMCVTPDTMITMADGSFKRIDEVELGDCVVTHDGVGAVTQLIVNDYEGPLQSIKSAGYALPLLITPNHETWAYGAPQRLFKSWQDTRGQGFKFYDESFMLDNDPAWIDAGDLKVHDWMTGPILPTSHRNYFEVSALLDELGVAYEIEDGRIYTVHARGRHTGSLPVYLTPSDAIMDVVGVYLAEGNFDAKRSEIQWTIHEDEENTYGKLLQTALDDLGAGTLRVYRRPEFTKGISLRVTNRPLALVLNHLAGTGSRSKQLHSWIMTLAPDLQERMFDAYWVGDGHNSGTRRTISTTSDLLAQQIHALLLRCGYLPSWSVAKNNGGPRGRGKELTINRIAYVPDRQFANGQRANGEGYYSAKINEIEEVQYQGQVYNLKVDGQESYVANGRIVHNCSHALALQYKAQSEGMFGREIKEDTQSPGWDKEITHYTPPPPKEWRASKKAVLPTPATKAYLHFTGSTEDEARDDDGKWTKGMGDSGFGKITPGEARGDSKKVTPQEFDELAEKGKAHYDRLLADKRPTTAFDDEDQWEKIRSGAFDAAQKSWGGQTIDPSTGRAIERSKGFSLQVRAPGEKQLSVPEGASEEEFNDMMDRARKEYATKLKASEVYLGVFRDDDNNRIDFDPVTIVDSEAEVDSLGAYTHAVGGAYDFATGNGHFPPHVASLSSDIKDAVHVWSTIKVNNKKALPNPEHDGFRYAFHQILGDVGSFRYNASSPEFMKGEQEATVFLKAFMDNQVPSHKPLYRAIGLHPAAYMTILTAATAGSVDLPPASWSANKSLTEQFGLDYMQGTKKYEERIIFVTRPGSTSWALGRTSNTSYEREHIVGGRFHVVSIKFPPETDNTTVITLQETEGWPEDFASTGDMIDHLAFDSEVYSPQDNASDPSRAVHDSSYHGTVDSELTSERSHGDAPLSVESANLGHLIESKLLSPTEDHSPLLSDNQTTRFNHISHVVESSAWTEVRDEVHADRTMARMPRIQVGSNLANEASVRPSVNSDHLAFEPERPVTVSEGASRPVPTFVVPTPVDFAPEPFLDIHAAKYSADHVDPHKGTMIAVRPPNVVCSELALADPDAEPVEQLHVTLAYIGPEASEDLDLDLLRQIVDAQSQLSPYIAGTLSGHGTFENPDGNVSVVLVDSEELQVARALMVDALERVGIEISREHGFVPHITLTYGDPGELEPVDKDLFYFTEFIISPPSGVWERYELATNILLAASVVVADQENPIPPTHNAEPSWGSSPIDQDDPTGSPLDADGETNTVLPGAQAVLDEEPEGALPSTDGDAGADGAQSDQDYYPTDEQINSKPYGGEGAAPTTIAWLDPRISNQGAKDSDNMDIAAAARNYLTTSTAVKNFTYAEQAEIVNEGEGVVASNLDRLDLRNTHYEALEAQLARAEAIGEHVYWWDE